MTFLGIISLLQITLLPGLIFTQIFNVSKSLTKIIISFSLSLIFNYQLIFLLTIFSLYNRVSVLIIFISEIILLLFVYTKKINFTVHLEDFSLVKPDPENRLLTLNDSYTRVLKYFFIGSGIFIFLGYFFKILEENPGIFDSWDDIFSWNRWAADWYSGRLPQRTYHYPQLIPANWSMTYKFMGTDEIQFFAKSVMGLFGFGILLIFWDLYAKSKSIYFLLALTISGYIIQKTVGHLLGKGYADIPVTFFCLCIFYVFYLGINGYMSITLSMVISAIVLSGAALTKQAGFFMIVPFVVMSYYLLKRSNYSFKRNSLIFGVSMIIYLLSTGPWYVYKQVQIKKGIESSEVSWVTEEIYSGKSKSQRLIDATTNFSNKVIDFEVLKFFPDHDKKILKDSLSIFFLFLLLLAFLSFYGRIGLILVVIPYYLIWGCFFSYDLKNISLLLPFLGLSVAIGAIIFLKYFSKLISLLNHTKLNKQFAVLIIALLLIAGISFKYDDKYLFQKEVEKSRLLIGDSAINSKLYNLYESKKMQGNILSGYVFMKFLPGIKQFYVSFTYDKQNLDSLKKIYQQNRIDHKIKYFLFQASAPVEITDFINQREKEGELKVNFESATGWYIEEVLEEKNK